MAKSDTNPTNPDAQKWLDKARTLSEALPYMREFSGETFVIKYGGHAMGDDTLAEKFARDVVLLKQVGINPVVVHGGGPQIGAMLERLKIESSFVDGLRVTDKATVDIVEMVLSGSINKQVVTAINRAGGTAVGISGKDGNMVIARRKQHARRDPDSNLDQVVDLGFVGEPHEVNTDLLHICERSSVIPVIAPLAVGSEGETLNVNADTMAGAIAAALGANKLIVLTDIAGVMAGDGALITELSPERAHALIEDGTIHGGMIPKVETCIAAVDNTVRAATLLDGRIPHVLLLEIFTEHGVGTMITRAESAIPA
jgi:acetylglutamate kinase